ncbi:hemicentin-2-like [Tropilaelaps mercedesae]|uniref:Hemicentin-2-like n=1 Tax=Tropilaelaps mercedesae TaxID=418985 RepID=A0A1V9XT14_9ACAR|nr:hemicentin-2-like [Tropilaelaps mercedesae]
MCGTCHTSEVPHIGPIKIPDDLAEGQRLMILCSVLRGTPPISFSWRKDGRPLIASSDVKIIHLDEFQEQLQISRLSSTHVANYTCQAKNAFGSDHMSTRIIMKYKPRWIVGNDSLEVHGIADKEIRVDCRAIGHPTPTVSIHKGT